MKITKHTAPDMRQALRAVREQLGPDAVILSSRRTADGVEITAAIDFDVAGIEAAAVAQETREPAHAHAAAPSAQSFEPTTFANVLREQTTSLPDEDKPSSPNDAVSEELKTLRRILETQVQQLAWNDLSRRAPIHTELLRQLSEIGLTPDFAAQLVAQLPAGLDLMRARRLALSILGQQLPVTGDRWLDGGGCIALVGPTGVGKTTTLAKLAVRWALRHGARDLALISADTARIGAHDQIQALGQLVGAATYTVDSFSELPAVLSRVAQRRFVLIDTPGVSQREAQLTTRLTELAALQPQIETALVLAATTQAGAIEEIVTRFAAAKVSSCLVTKVDEAASLGGLLSVLTRAGLPISYVSEGQRVPEDLRPARALELVSTAVALAKANGAVADEDLLRRRFGDVAHVLA
jgi:flagellar biosynthesis protein FlhF